MKINTEYKQGRQAIQNLLRIQKERSLKKKAERIKQEVLKEVLKQ